MTFLSLPRNTYTFIPSAHDKVIVAPFILQVQNCNVQRPLSVLLNCWISLVAWSFGLTIYPKEDLAMPFACIVQHSPKVVEMA